MTIETVLDPTELYNNMMAANKHIISPLRMQSKQLGSEMLVTEYFRTVRNRGLFKFLTKNKIYIPFHFRNYWVLLIYWYPFIFSCTSSQEVRNIYFK